MHLPASWCALGSCPGQSTVPGWPRRGHCDLAGAKRACFSDITRPMFTRHEVARGSSYRSAKREASSVEPVSERHVGSRSEEHTSELQSLMRISYAVFCLKKKKKIIHRHIT